MAIDIPSYILGKEKGSGRGGSGVTVDVPVGKKYATGTYTLASDNSHLSFNPGLDFMPSVVKIAMRTPIYGQNATIGAVYISLSGLAIGTDARQFLYTALETRTSYSGYAIAQSDNYIVTHVGDPTFSSTGFTFVSRLNTYPFNTGVYNWEAWE